MIMCHQNCREHTSFPLAQAAQVGVEDVSRAYTLFLDVQRSTQFMVDHADQVMFSCSFY